MHFYIDPTSTSLTIPVLCCKTHQQKKTYREVRTHAPKEDQNLSLTNHSATDATCSARALVGHTVYSALLPILVERSNLVSYHTPKFVSSILFAWLNSEGDFKSRVPVVRIHFPLFCVWYGAIFICYNCCVFLIYNMEMVSPFAAIFSTGVRGIVVMIVACQVMDPGPIPGERMFLHARAEPTQPFVSRTRVLSLGLRA
jgi:hypothetical protein